MLTSAEARSIARALWGEVNGSQRTNTKGAFWFDCSGHGGFIVSADIFGPTKREWIEKYVSVESAIRYIGNKRSVLMHGYRTRGARLAYHSTENVEFYIFEEDCAWAVAALAGITLKSAPDMADQAKDTFWRWYDESNPEVANRKEVDRKRAEGDGDLIISAVMTDEPGVTKVWTANNQIHYVRGYDKARDEYNTPYLSLCEAA
jgi:hypothetical protein